MEIEGSTLALFATSAAAYGALSVLLLLSGRGNRTRALLVAACAASGASAAGIAAGWVDVLGPSGAIAELAFSAPWCVFILHLLHRQGQKPGELGLAAGFGIVIGMTMVGLAFVESDAQAVRVPLPVMGQLYLRIGFAVYGVLLIENLFRNTPSEFRWHIKLLCIGIGGFFAYGIIFYADALLYRRLSLVLWDGRAVALMIAAPLIAVSAARNRNWAIDIHVSRAVVFHSATLVASGIFLLGLALTGELVRAIGAGWGDLAEVTLFIAGIALMGVLLSSGAARSRLQRFLSENFFTHRYDYRKEWLKSIEVLSANPSRATVQTRVITAVAEIADSPAGVLWVRDVDGQAFRWAGSWNSPAIGTSELADSEFIAMFRGGEWVVELGASMIKPGWIDEIPGAWIAVPLARQDELIGFIVLVRPRAPLTLDRETFDLLRIVGRQAATHVAEQRFAQALAEGRELQDYGKRFAFLVHDMKNIAGQLSFIVQNARHHQGNPEFHEDVLKTVNSALDRMNSLLKKLRPGRSCSELLVPLDVIQETVKAIGQTRGVDIGLEHDGRTSAVTLDTAAFRSIIAHLCENAVEAGSKVKVCVHHDPMRLQIDVRDDGAGMTPEFIRDHLFRPFGSTKSGGFGIGAYQARELLRAAGGDLLVASRPGKGTTMSILLPCSTPQPLNSVPSGLEAAG